MCGINGIVGLKNIKRARQFISNMNDGMAHRGPDDAGIFSEQGIAMGHRRLSIIDLSRAGHQPMMSSDKRYCITFNGEIYNFKSLKKKLDKYPFHSHTDTEVILAAYQKWGKSCLEMLDGMFAFAIWDKQKQELFIARDRIGIKPLYYYQNDEKLIFASEIRSILASGLVSRKLNTEALVDYLRYQTVHAPGTIVKDIKMLMPGHHMIFAHGQLQIQEYWNPVENRRNSSYFENKGYDEITNEISDLLDSATEERLMADVPFGAFLSGGIDSSTIVGLMSRACNKKVNTFSVSFAEDEFDESRYARMVADKFETNHTEIRLKPEDFLELLPEALNAMDHPSGDGPNTYVVSKVTKEAGIKVALSGLGGDEVFAGYEVFKRLKKLNHNQWMLNIPSSLRTGIGQALKQIRPSSASNKISAVLSMESWDINETYPQTRQILQDKQILFLLNRSHLVSSRVAEILGKYIANGSEENRLPTLSKISVAEISTYMQNVLLRDTDNMSMANSLEVRVPLLDHQLLEYVLGVADNDKYPSSPKKLLTDATAGLLPEQVINRPKMGFTLPWNTWLRNDMNEFCNNHLQMLGQRQEFDATAVNRLWQLFLEGNDRVSWSRIWILVVLEYWLNQNSITS